MPPTIESYLGNGYGQTAGSPTEDKPQSKLWYAYQTWWALMVDPATSQVSVFQLTDEHRWVNTGTVVQRIPDGTADVLWDGQHAHLAVRYPSAPLEVSRLSFDESRQTWSVDDGFPVQIAPARRAESITIARDGTGTLWVTFVQQGVVLVAHSLGRDDTWSTPYAPAGTAASVSSDDISSVVSFDGAVGVMWSDQVSGRFRFVVHRDGDPDEVWSVETASEGLLDADDHVNLTTAEVGGESVVLAAVKSSVDEVSGVPGSAEQISVLVRTPDGTWSSEPAGIMADGHTRPILVVDDAADELYLIAGAAHLGVYYKRSPLERINLAAGRGEPLMRSPGGLVADPTSTKQAVTAESGLVVVASVNRQRRYVHAEATLGDSPPDTTVPSSPSVLAAEATPGCKVTLTWPPGSDETELAGYVVSRDGSRIASPSTTSWTDPSPGCAAEHIYSVESVDFAGNTSAATSAASVTTPAGFVRGRGIWLRSSTTGSNAAGRSLRLDAPDSEPGDVMVATIGTIGNPAVVPPSTWPFVRRDVNRGALSLTTYAHVVDASEPAEHTFDIGGDVSATGHVLAFAGASARYPIVEASSGGNNNNETDARVVAPSVAVEEPGSVVLAVFAANNLVSIAPPVDMVDGPSGSNNLLTSRKITVATASLVGMTGSTGDMVAKTSSAWQSIGQLIVLRPATPDEREG